MSPRGERGSRLFFALWPGEAVREQLASWSRELRAVCGGRAPRPGDLHLTLAFLGSVDPGRVEAIERAASQVRPRAATLILDRPGFWKHNRIVWAGAASVPQEIESLVAELRGALTRSAIAFDPKPFVSHVTLLRDAREAGALPALAPIHWAIEGFVLAGSPPSRGGYEILRAW